MPKIFQKIMTFAVVLLLANSVIAQDNNYHMPNATEPMDNLTVGGQPSEQDIHAFKAAGIETIINLRLPGEFDSFDESKLVKDLGMIYISIPVEGRAGVTVENAAALHAALEQADGKVVLHCASGFRAASLLALEQYLHEGLDQSDAIDLAVSATGDRVRDFVTGLIADTPRD